MSSLCQNLSVSKNLPLTFINQEICGQKPNLNAILWKILTSMKFCGDYYGINFMKIKDFLLAMHHGDESVSRGRMTGTRGRGTGTIGTKGRTIGTKERGNEKPYGLVQIEYWDRGTSTRHVWTWRGRVTLFLDV